MLSDRWISRLMGIEGSGGAAATLVFLPEPQRHGGSVRFHADDPGRLAGQARKGKALPAPSSPVVCERYGSDSGRRAFRLALAFPQALVQAHVALSGQ